jgi:hypothetical protein
LNGFPLSGGTILVIAGENVISTLDYHICFIQRKREGSHLNRIPIMSLTDHINILYDYKTELIKDFSGFSRSTVFSIVELQSHNLIDVGRMKRQPHSVPYARFKSFYSSPLT